MLLLCPANISISPPIIFHQSTGMISEYVFSCDNFLQIWQMRTGPRLRIIQCAKGAKILQPTYRFGSSTTSPYVPLEVFLLNGDSGQISVLNRTLNWFVQCKTLFILIFYCRKMIFFWLRWLFKFGGFRWLF